ncbi:MAG: small multi-drug export protein [Candidatus Marinimicrobia bacterium]|nr:small multi-drug export protein [Candidatus Neomarinimicrobiota bacterium]MCF7850588.1 small multi-drug export protein [Candidatus Neomarinimicrobiota bacterium]MCF7903678.1 small multi-drug export protein [Candidatus Neomarinimicrobiota bacterium]
MRKLTLLPESVALVFTLLFAQYTLGKKVSFPLGIFLGFSVPEIAILVILSDFVLMILVDRIFVWSLDKLPWLQKLRKKSERFQERMGQRKISVALIRLGWLGPLTITALPFAGGVWSGMALSRLMSLSHQKTFLAVGLGVLIGCLIFALASMGVLNFIELSTEH